MTQSLTQGLESIDQADVDEFPAEEVSWVHLLKNRVCRVGGLLAISKTHMLLVLPTLLYLYCCYRLTPLTETFTNCFVFIFFSLFMYHADII